MIFLRGHVVSVDFLTAAHRSFQKIFTTCVATCIIRIFLKSEAPNKALFTFVHRGGLDDSLPRAAKKIEQKRNDEQPREAKPKATNKNKNL